VEAGKSGNSQRLRWHLSCVGVCKTPHYPWRPPARVSTLQREKDDDKKSLIYR
jgi:hypothetical protein